MIMEENLDTDMLRSGLSPVTSISLCLILSILYVVSLYVWKQEYNRDHPTTIKRRFYSVFIVSLISLSFVYIFSNKIFLKTATFSGILGLRLPGLFLSSLVGLILTAILFAGPLCVEILNGYAKNYLNIQYWINGVNNIQWLRNHFVAPLTEELTFRACMMALLIQSFAPKTVVLITPFFFSIAHYHHLFEMKFNGMDIKTALIISTFQFFYTTIFGYYSAYLFARTGHFAAPFIAHCFCNHMGFPDVQQILEEKGFKKIILTLFYIIGFAMWILLLPYATTPSWYDNKLYWKS